MIIDKDTTFKIVNIVDADYDYPRDEKKESLEQLFFKNSSPKSRKKKVVQLEQVS